MNDIAVIPGDGIGREVMEATINVLESLDVDFNFIYGEAGDECLEKTGEALPKETIELAKNSDACLFGAAGETAADVIVRLRQELNLFANLRPVKSYPNTNALFEDGIPAPTSTIFFMPLSIRALNTSSLSASKASSS